MPTQPLRILVSGASVAGPTTAYWLARQGFAVTVVERMPLARVRTGGHAVDLFGPAMDVAEWTGVLPEVMEARTRTEVLEFHRAGARPVEVDLRQLMAGISSKHVEVMRGELAGILYDAGRDQVEYVFEDSIRTLEQRADDVAVTFEHGPERTFDLVVGADGLHSVVRRLAFGPEEAFRNFLGGYLTIFSLPDYLNLENWMMVHNAPGRLAAVYPVPGAGGTARGGFLFRRPAELPVDHRDVSGQKRILHEIYGSDGWEVPRLLHEMDTAADFYFDSISQIVLQSWSTGRATLVGDAGYSPGPAVGGGTSLALVGGYVLAEELARAGADHARGLRAYEERMRQLVVRSRAIGPTTMNLLIPRTARQVRVIPQLMRVVTRLPAPVQRRVSSLQATPARALGAIDLRPPPREPEQRSIAS